MTNRADTRVIIADYGLAKRSVLGTSGAPWVKCCALRTAVICRQGARHKAERGTDISRLILIENNQSVRMQADKAEEIEQYGCCESLALTGK